LLGLIGGVVGTIVGWLAATVLSAVGIPMPPAPGMASAYTAEVLVTVPVALQGIAIAVATALIASLYPARKAARMQIVDALRHNR
jgi:putative ABC transport system permease protein